MNDGLKDKHREAIIRILSATPRVERAVLFGSRAMGTHTAASDVDIALFGDELTLDDQAKLAAQIEKQPIPQQVDLLRHHVIKNKELLTHIKTYGIEWHSREAKSVPADAGRRRAMGNEWKEVVLGEVAEVCLGKMLDQHKNKGRYLPYLANTNVQWGRFQLDDLRQMRFQTHEAERYGLKCGDIVMCEGGEPGRCAMWRDEAAGMMFQKALHRIRPFDGMDSRYLYYCLFESGRVGAYEPLLTGTTIKHLPRQNLLQFRFRAAPFPIQTRIAHVLGTLDDRIELNRRMNRTLEKMAAALFKSWFVDFDPVRAKADGRDPGLPADIAALFPDSFTDSPLGPIPQGWEPGSLGDIAESPRRGVNPSDVSPTTPYMGLEHMPRRCIALDSWGHASDVASGKSQFRKGEILFGKLRPYFHKVGIAPMDGVCSTDIVVVAPKSADWCGYVLSLVSSNEFVDYTDAHSGGTKMPRTNWNDMSRYPLALPPISVASAFQKHIACAHQRIISNIHQNRRLAGLRDTLLPKLLNGEIEVPELEGVL